MGYFNADDGCELFYRDSGQGMPVILIHGWPLSSDMWEYQKLELLTRGFRVITYDRRGFGQSEHFGFGYDYNTFADDLSALIEHLGLAKVALVGFSMGGGEIARYLSRHGSSKITSVALIGAVTPYLLKDESNKHGVEASVFADMISNLEQDRPKFLTSFTKMFFGANMVKHPVSEETQHWCFMMALRAELKATVECVNAFGKTDFRPDMAAFDVPTLIIHGDADKTVPIATSGDRAAEAVPQATYKKYEGAPHGLFITHKDQLNRDLVEFLMANQFEVDAIQRAPRIHPETSPTLKM